MTVPGDDDDDGDGGDDGDDDDDGGGRENLPGTKSQIKLVEAGQHTAISRYRFIFVFELLRILTKNFLLFRSTWTILALLL